MADGLEFGSMEGGTIYLKEPESPDYCQVFINIGSNDAGSFTPVPPEYLISFNHKVMPEGQGTMSLTLFDFTGLLLEQRLHEIGLLDAQNNPLYVYYGLTRSGIFSDVYKMVITNYTPSFMNGGIQINLELLSICLWKMSTIDYIKTFPKCDGKLSKYTRYMCDQKGIGWTDKSVPDNDKKLYQDKGMKRLANFDTRNGSFLQLMRKYAPVMQDEQGNQNYVYYHDDTTGTFYFHPSLLGNPDAKNIFIKYDVYGPQSQLVLGFTPTYNGMLLKAVAGNEVICDYYLEHSNTVSKSVSKFIPDDETKKDEKTKTVAKTSSLPSTDLGKLRVDGYSKTLNNLMLTATIDIYGYYKFKLFQKIFVAVFVNADGIYAMEQGRADGQGKPGGLHFSTGWYLIKGITYNYSGGRIIATLDMIRTPNSNQQGQADVDRYMSDNEAKIKTQIEATNKFKG